MKISNPYGSPVSKSSGSTVLQKAKNLFVRLVNALFGAATSPPTRLGGIDRSSINGTSDSTHLANLSELSLKAPKPALRRTNSTPVSQMDPSTQAQARRGLQRSRSVPALRSNEHLGDAKVRLLDMYDRELAQLSKIGQRIKSVPNEGLSPKETNQKLLTLNQLKLKHTIRASKLHGLCVKIESQVLTSKSAAQENSNERTAFQQQSAIRQREHSDLLKGVS